MTYLDDPSYMAAEADYLSAPEDRVAPADAYLDDIAQRQERRRCELEAQAAHRGMLARIVVLGLARDPGVPRTAAEAESEVA